MGKEKKNIRNYFYIMFAYFIFVAYKNRSYKMSVFALRLLAFACLASLFWLKCPIYASFKRSISVST